MRPHVHTHHRRSHALQGALASAPSVRWPRRLAPDRGRSTLAQDQSRKAVPAECRSADTEVGHFSSGRDHAIYSQANVPPGGENSCVSRSMSCIRRMCCSSSGRSRCLWRVAMQCRSSPDARMSLVICLINSAWHIGRSLARAAGLLGWPLS